MFTHALFFRWRELLLLLIDVRYGLVSPSGVSLQGSQCSLTLEIRVLEK